MRKVEKKEEKKQRKKKEKVGKRRGKKSNCWSTGQPIKEAKKHRPPTTKMATFPAHTVRYDNIEKKKKK